MKPRQLIRGAAFPPDELNVIYKAFDDAWAEVTPDVSAVCRAFRCPVRLAVPDLAGQLGHLRDSGWSAGI